MIKRGIKGLLPPGVRRGLRLVYRALVKPGSLAPSPPPVFEIGDHGGFSVAFRRNTTDEDVIGHSFDRDIFFPALAGYQPGPGDVVIDVGAHIGTFSMLAARMCPGARVFALEACRESFDLLRANVSLNGLDNVVPVRVALSDRRGVARLNYDEGNWGHSIVTPAGGGGEDVPSESLAGFLAGHQIDSCQLMKMNCEGAEFPIILAADGPALARFERILILYHCDLYRGSDEGDLVDHLGAAGFAITFVKRGGPRGWLLATRR